MKAARVQDGAVRVLDVPDPVLGKLDALIRISTAGVCHSDLHLARGDWGFAGSGLLGHEAIGVVEAVDEEAQQFVQVGDRVILGLGGTGGGFWCGACEYCLSGRPRHCALSKPVMGVFAEYFAAYAPGLVQLPDALGDLEASLACGGLTAYGAVKKLPKYGVIPGQTVAVIGAAGGLGHYAVQLLKAFGYDVVGVDIGDERLDFVRSLGARAAVEPADAMDAVAATGGCHAALVFSAKMAGFELGLRLLRKGGLFVAVGLPATSEGNLSLNPFEFFLKDPTLIYSAVGTVQDMRELVDLAASGVVRSSVSRTGPMSELDTIFSELEAAQYHGRAVLTDMSR